MSWHCTIEQQDKQQHILLTHPKRQQLKLHCQRPCQWAESATAIAIVVGRVRPYAEDYLQDNAAQWLLNCYQQNTDAVTDKLAGFFLLLIADKTTDSIYLINDHVGSIPCYIRQQADGSVSISDNLPALAATQPPLAAQAMFNYLFFHCIPSPLSIYQGISKLEPGVKAHIDSNGSLQQKLYYQPAFTRSADSPQQLM